jgi:predicted nucleic acid-binding protein
VTLVDSNVLLDLFIQTPGWWEWSVARLEDAARQGPLLVNDVIFAETSIRFSVIEDFEAALSQAGITVAPIPRMALFLAGKASIQYRNAGGARSSVLPNFLIGAHAAVAQLPLLTRDTRRYRTYFPTVTLIAPNSETGA